MLHKLQKYPKCALLRVGVLLLLLAVILLPLGILPAFPCPLLAPLTVVFPYLLPGLN